MATDPTEALMTRWQNHGNAAGNMIGYWISLPKIQTCFIISNLEPYLTDLNRSDKKSRMNGDLHVRFCERTKTKVVFSYSILFIENNSSCKLFINILLRFMR